MLKRGWILIREPTTDWQEQRGVAQYSTRIYGESERRMTSAISDLRVTPHTCGGVGVKRTDLTMSSMDTPRQKQSTNYALISCPSFKQSFISRQLFWILILATSQLNLCLAKVCAHLVWMKIDCRKIVSLIAQWWVEVKGKQKKT